ncbi:cytochrome c3 family protein [Desulfovibrio sp. OttesenSCG-928-C06]|nr:cytochrome c3 family protein [Desulfovibrio sp. OttesenSCG-928-C06]
MKCHKSKYVLFLMLLAAVTLSLGLTSGTSRADDEAAVIEECLSCHGPFEDLMEATKDYQDEWGEKVNPHMYVDITQKNPHQSTKIVPCIKCHEAHPVPPEGDMAIKKANLKYCYNCHHDETFELCSNCHKE